MKNWHDDHPQLLCQVGRRHIHTKRCDARRWGRATPEADLGQKNVSNDLSDVLEGDPDLVDEFNIFSDGSTEADMFDPARRMTISGFGRSPRDFPRRTRNLARHWLCPMRRV